jgi:hypothetical protein
MIKKFDITGILLYLILMNMISATLLLLVVVGCELEETKHQAIQGERYITPKHGVTYYGMAGDAAGIDAAADWWLEWGALRGVDPVASYAVLQACEVSVLAGETVNGTHAAWWYGDGWIEVARAAPYASDRYFGLDSAGLMWLRHEWLHELYKDPSHSRFPNPE